MKILYLWIFLYMIKNGVGLQTDSTYEDDVKELFFRHLRALDLNEELNRDKLEDDYNIPKPGGLEFDNSDIDKSERIKRSYHVLQSPGLKSHFKIYIPDEKTKYKRSKRQLFSRVMIHEEIDNSTKNNSQTLESINNKTNESNSSNIIVNDFIRFKRNSDEISKSGNDSQSRSKREPEIRTEKMVMERDYNEPGTDREPRGATKEQWIKQPYPVEHPIEDNIPSASDNIRAPRVHFVTQRRSGPGLNPNQRSASNARQLQSQQPVPSSPPSPPPLSHNHRVLDTRDREGRSRDFDLYPRSESYYPYPRPRSFDFYRPRYYDPYFERFDDRRFGFDGFDSRFKYEDDRPMLPPPPPQITNKQRRIIYYATLPEVIRTPSPTGDRYNYRQDRYEDRYLTGSLNSMSGLGAPSAGPPVAPNDYYRTRKSYGNNQLQKHRDYDNGLDRKKTPLYPVKVSTDVNIREPKKNPERRIYSEVESRYDYKSPPSFETAEDRSF